MKQIIAYELVDHGVEHEQYFQGCGVAFTSYTDVFTGIGASLYEALDDAAEQLATSGFEIPPELDAELKAAPGDTPYPELSEDTHYYASIRVRAGGAK